MTLRERYIIKHLVCTLTVMDVVDRYNAAWELDARLFDYWGIHDKQR